MININANINGAKRALATPSIPTDLAITVTSDTVLTLTFVSAFITELWRSTTEGGTYTLIATVDKGTLTYDNTGLTQGTEYFYKARGKNGSKYSAFTSVVSAFILPQKAIITDEVTIESFESIGAWVTAGYAGLNSTEKIEGDNSIKLTSALGTAVTLEKAVNYNFSGDNGASFRLRMFPNSTPSTTWTSIVIYLGNNSSMTNSFRSSINASTIFANQWNILWGLSWITNTGNPDWADIKYIRIRVNTISGQTSVCSFDWLSSNQVIVPAICITFDDGSSTQYTNAFPALKARNMVSTHYMITSYINENGRLTTAQLLDLEANNCMVGNHTQNHTTLTTLTEEQIVTELEAGKTDLNAIGLTKGDKHVAYPQGAYSDTVLSAVTSWGAKTGRLSNNRMPNNWEIGYPYKLSMYSPSNETTVADVKLQIDRIKAVNGIGFLNFHNIVNSNAVSSIDYLTADFIEILDYINTIGIITITVDEFYNIYAGRLLLTRNTNI